MNENIDLTKILKDCPIGTKLYLTLCGEVKLIKVENDTYPICVENINGDRFWLTQDGKHISGLDGECILFPSKEQRDWSKFTDPWYKKDKFESKNNVHFYVARDIDGELWLYLSKPNRCTDTFCSHHGVLVSAEDFPKFGLNEKDYDYLKWEDEPVEVFLNLED